MIDRERLKLSAEILKKELSSSMFDSRYSDIKDAGLTLIYLAEQYLEGEIGEMVSESEINQTVRDGTLRRILDDKDNQTLVFFCCGGIGKPIEDRGLCPHCKTENVEVVNKWKYDLAKALVGRVPNLILARMKGGV